jgi:hypothetical protein
VLALVLGSVSSESSARPTVRRIQFRKQHKPLSQRTQESRFVFPLDGGWAEIEEYDVRRGEVLWPKQLRNRDDLL